MNVDAASNRADNQDNNMTDGDDAPNTADITYATGGASNQVKDAMDGNDTPDITDMTDATMFEIIMQTQTSLLLDLDSTVPDPEQIPLAELESPSEDLPNPLEPGSSDTQPPVVIERFPHGNPGAPIDGMQGYSIYESSQGALDGSVWALFQSKSDWHITHWAKTIKLSSSALSDLFAIPDVCPPFCFAPTLLNEV